jgi:hypothetical protein
MTLGNILIPPEMLETLPVIVAGLVREGVTFKVYPPNLNADGFWEIELTGGY